MKTSNECGCDLQLLMVGIVPVGKRRTFSRIVANPRVCQHARNCSGGRRLGAPAHLGSNLAKFLSVRSFWTSPRLTRRAGIGGQPMISTFLKSFDYG